jgi:hypothetical protein
MKFAQKTEPGSALDEAHGEDHGLPPLFDLAEYTSRSLNAIVNRVIPISATSTRIE